MIYELKDPQKAEKLFAGMNDTLIRACLQGVMGKIYVTELEKPRSAVVHLGLHLFYAGEPSRELVAFKPKGMVGMTAPDAAWDALIREYWGEVEEETRFALRKDTKFDRAKLQALVAALPAGYEIRRIDGALFDACRASDDLDACGMSFASREQFLELGRGFAVLKDGEPVSAASSYAAFREGLDIQVNTAEGEEGKGLASAVCAALILSCLDDGLYPSWDASSETSLHLAQKLGYEPEREYVCLWLDDILDRAIENPDRSQWDSFCGKYERQGENSRIYEILRRGDDLRIQFVNSAGEAMDLKLYPIGEKRFGIAWSDDEIVFAGGGMLLDEIVCPRL